MLTVTIISDNLEDAMAELREEADELALTKEPSLRRRRGYALLRKANIIHNTLLMRAASMDMDDVTAMHSVLYRTSTVCAEAVGSLHAVRPQFRTVKKRGVKYISVTDFTDYVDLVCQESGVLAAGGDCNQLCNELLTLLTEYVVR